MIGLICTTAKYDLQKIWIEKYKATGSDKKTRAKGKNCTKKDISWGEGAEEVKSNKGTQFLSFVLQQML